jgi:hypothetical protein
MFGIVMDVRNVGIYSNRRDVNNSRNGSHTRDFSPTWAPGTKLARNRTRKKSNGRTDLDIRDARISGHSRYSISTAERTTGVAGPKATRERAGTPGDANNSRAAKLVEMEC